MPRWPDALVCHTHAVDQLSHSLSLWCISIFIPSIFALCCCSSNFSHIDDRISQSEKFPFPPTPFDSRRDKEVHWNRAEEIAYSWKCLPLRSAIIIIVVLFLGSEQVVFVLRVASNSEYCNMYIIVAYPVLLVLRPTVTTPSTAQAAFIYMRLCRTNIILYAHKLPFLRALFFLLLSARFLAIPIA